MHMVCDELNILLFLVLGQNANDNAYSAPFCHEVWNVDQKRIRMGIDLYYNKFSHLCVKRQHYPEHDTLCMPIFFP